MGEFSQPDTADTADTANDPSASSIQTIRAKMNDRVAQGQQAFPGGITIIGDSVSLATAGATQQVIGPADIVAEVGFDMFHGADTIASMDASGTLSEYLVISLAFNSHANSFPAIDSILQSLGPGYRVVIVTSSDDIGGMLELSAYLRTLDELYPFVTIDDWAQATKGRPDLMAADGFHPATDDAIDLYVSMLADALAIASTKPTS